MSLCTEMQPKVGDDTAMVEVHCGELEGWRPAMLCVWPWSPPMPPCCVCLVAQGGMRLAVVDVGCGEVRLGCGWWRRAVVASHGQLWRHNRDTKM